MESEVPVGIHMFVVMISIVLLYVVHGINAVRLGMISLWDNALSLRCCYITDNLFR